MRSKYKRTTMNISLPPEIKAALKKVPKWEHPTSSAYVVSLVIKDLQRRNLLPKRPNV
jgi:hypothetical protein